MLLTHGPHNLLRGNPAGSGFALLLCRRAALGIWGFATSLTSKVKQVAKFASVYLCEGKALDG